MRRKVVFVVSGLQPASLLHEAISCFAHAIHRQWSRLDVGWGMHVWQMCGCVVFFCLFFGRWKMDWCSDFRRSIYYADGCQRCRARQLSMSA